LFIKNTVAWPYARATALRWLKKTAITLATTGQAKP